MAQPALHAWTPAQQPLRLIEQTIPSADPDPKALACYGLLVQERTTQGVSQEHVWLRFVAARPVSAVTVEVLTWVCAKLTAVGNGSATTTSASNAKARASGLSIVPCPSKAPGSTPWKRIGSMENGPWSNPPAC